MQFYEVDGVLVRRWVPAKRRRMMEVWMGDGWAPYTDVEQVLRFGNRLNEEEALWLLQETRALFGTFDRLSDEEARVGLTDRRLRAASSAPL